MSTTLGIKYEMEQTLFGFPLGHSFGAEMLSENLG